MDAVHDMRVASRRTREALRLFAPIYRRKAVDEWNAAITQVTRALGGVRDDDVYIAAFTRLLGRANGPDTRTALAYLIGYRQGQRRVELDRMRRRLGKLHLAEHRKSLEKTLCDTRTGPEARQPLGELAFGAVTTRLAAAYEHVPAALAPEASAEQHAMRIAVKKLRYAVEDLRPCFDDRYDALLETLVRFQDELGELHDCDVFLAHVRDVLRSPEPRVAGVSRRGLADVVADLEARRARRFQRFSRLAKANPQAKVRKRLLSAIVWKPAEAP